MTDHQPLISLRKMKDPHGRIARWMLEFQGHTFDIIYRSGEKNHVDALSRMVAGDAIQRKKTSYRSTLMMAKMRMSDHLLAVLC